MARISIKRGDSLDYDTQIIRNGAAEDLAGATVWFTAKSDLRAEDADAEIQTSNVAGGVVFLVPSEGKIRITLEPEETYDLDAPIELHYDIQLLTAAGKLDTVEDGHLVIRPGATRTMTP